MGLTTLEPTASVGEVVAVIEDDGGVIIRDFLSAEALAGLEADLRPILDSLAFGVDEDFAGKKTRRLGGVFKHTRHADEVVRNPLYRQTAERFLAIPERVWFGEDAVEVVPTLQVGVTQVIEIHPGEGAQPLHRDDAVWQWRHPEGGRQARVQIMIAISDFTEENGGTLVVPGSHKWDDTRAPKRDEAVSTVMTAGSALIWIGSTYHGGGDNNSRSPRTGLTLSFDLGYLRQEENHYLVLPQEQARMLPDDIAKLVGYQACPPFMGWVEVGGVMRDPHVLLEDEIDPSAQAAAGNPAAP
ncbi:MULTISPECIES: phytanoyl-CoA dioxygenase family protein [Rhodococcus]|uniref:phytanoyl-CoA dioxygenase family protein n=1 Tax=Rhodococcus TaxID=1827 RepID=UPI00102212E5|nr:MULTISPECIES: phytanoyl-CoA dioxygenase family protein [Rhodococcus]UTT50903.1 phytanoyl-CoA dioxygenase family protein [Rhodococcus gordoniae]